MKTAFDNLTKEILRKKLNEAEDQVWKLLDNTSATQYQAIKGTVARALEILESLKPK